MLSKANESHLKADLVKYQRISRIVKNSVFQTGKWGLARHRLHRALLSLIMYVLRYANKRSRLS